AWLKHKLTDGQAAAVRELKIRGVGLRREFQRAYPGGPLGAHVLGLVNIDDLGGEGVERAMDAWLRGGSGRSFVDVDVRRRPVTPVGLRDEGASVTLTIDARLQRIAGEELDAAMEEWTPRWASVVVLDPRTGALLAMANRPTFDPNDPGAAEADFRRNRAITDTYEPGSTLKPFWIAGALEEGLVTPGTKFTCEGSVRLGPRLLHDHKTHGTVDVTNIIVRSCNVGAAKIGVEHLGAERLRRYADGFGFGRRTGVELPAECRGKLKPLDDWTPYYTASSVSIGHEISVTPLQLAAATAVLANGGVRRPVHVVDRVCSASGALLRRTSVPAGRRVLSVRTAKEIRAMLVEAVERGTGRRVRIDGVRVAAKTGTSQKYDPEIRAYSHEKYASSFICFAPAGPDDVPKIVIAVVVDEPQGAYYGGRVAAPVARGIEGKRCRDGSGAGKGSRRSRPTSAPDRSNTGAGGGRCVPWLGA
ncbi:MAG: peptidoglycan D,D-transpeptidase FtsI family protein, partial [Planctomycetota bacterium]